MERIRQIGYDVHMTRHAAAHSDLLGAPLPGVISLPFWGVKIERRGGSEILVWNVASSPAPPATNDTGLVSLPRPIRAATIKRGEYQRRQRSARRASEGSANAEELLAAFRDAGGHIQLRRRIAAGEPPFYGGAGALDDFITLGEQPPEAIQAFAAHWGPLGICEHRCPWTHSLARRSPISTEPVCSPLGISGSQGRSGWEEVDRWRYFSREAKNITLHAIALRHSRAERRQDELQYLFDRVATWLELAAVPLVTCMEVETGKAWPHGFGAAFAITGVFQILALQLLGVVAGGRELAQCTHCGLPFVLSGHREGNRRFCRTCIERKVPFRYAARDYRARHPQHK
jgi:hypothetical protein